MQLMQINLSEILNHFATANKINLDYLYGVSYLVIFNITHTALKEIKIKKLKINPTSFNEFQKNYVSFF